MTLGRKVGMVLAVLVMVLASASVLSPILTKCPIPSEGKAQSSNGLNPLQARNPANSSSSFSTTIPPIKNSVSIGPTGTITRRSDNQSVWLWDINIIDKDWLGGKSKPATVLKLKFTVKPNNLTQILYTDNVSAGVENFNQGYLYNGENITSTEFLDLQTEITQIPVHASIGRMENAVTRPITPPTGEEPTG